MYKDSTNNIKLYLSEFTGSGEPIRLIRRNPQIPYPLHTHDFSELVIILGGSGTHITNFSRFELLAGDVFVINGETAHGYENPNNLHLINILYRPELLTKNAADLTTLPGYHVLFNLEPKFREDHQFNSKLHISPRQITEITPFIQEIEKELKYDNPGRLFMASALFYSLLGHLCRMYSNEDVNHGRQLLRIGKAIGHLENSLQKTVTLTELTKLTAMSVSTLNRTFKEATGYSPIEYHLRIRIKKASEILCNSSFNITEIAYRTGFDDSNYFSRQFKKIMGVSPLEFRKGYF
ncbi:MAG: AraC family transcriptional regulator [Bacteroidetes bacterium]|nr:MAG: AraC family transcriptional regulator [Bacteroidota bacterium]